MDRWADGQMGRWADGQMGRWADGQMGRWADGQTMKFHERVSGASGGVASRHSLSLQRPRRRRVSPLSHSGRIDEMDVCALAVLDEAGHYRGGRDVYSIDEIAGGVAVRLNVLQHRALVGVSGENKAQAAVEFSEVRV